MAGYTETLFSQSMAGFFHDSKSAVLDNKMRAELVSKSRVLYMKVPLAKAIINTLTRGVIGSGLHLAPENELFGVLSATYCLDASQQQDLYQLQQQAFETMLLSGECWLIRQKAAKDGYSSWYLAEPDHVFNPPFASIGADGNSYHKNHLLIDGIEYAANGKPLAIHYCRNPYMATVANKKAWDRIFLVDKEGLPNAIQLRLTDRPEYPRGLPILAPLIETLYGLYAYSQAQIQMGLLQSCQALVVKTNTNKTLNPFAAMSQSDLNAPLNAPKDSHNPSPDFAITPPNNRDVFGLTNAANYVVPGQTIHLNPDESLECITPTGPSNSLIEYYNLVLEQCCAALGIPKPLLNGVFDASFSASKASIAQWEYTISKYRKAFVEQLLKPLYRVFLYESGEIDLAGAYTRSIHSEWLSHDPPMCVDEVRTMNLMRQAYDLGLVTRDEIAQTLFAHTAHEDERRPEFTTIK